jgi:periplasmic protein TonB
MEMGNILSADVLDIIFDQRNKEYGAYDLRKNYQRRLTKSLIVTVLVVVLICLTYILLGSMKPGADKLEVNGIVTLEKIPEKEKPAEKIAPPPVKATPPPAIKMQQFTKPLIVDVDPPENERPPEQATLETAKIGTVNSQGTDDIGIVGPPVDVKTAVVDVPKKHDDGDEIPTFVEIESQYPGGISAWSAFLYRNLVYPQQAIDDGKQGTVYVQFIVDLEGNVSDVKAVSGPEEFYTAAISVIKKSGKWTVAIQNGRKVKSYKKQPITFKLAD